MYSLNSRMTFCSWMPEKPVKVLIQTRAGPYMYGVSFKSRDDAIKSIASELGDLGWISVIDGMIKASEVIGMEFFGESDTELAPIRAYFDTDDGRHTCAIPFHSFEEAENDVTDWIANREWLMCEGSTIRSSTVKSFGLYDMRGKNS